MILRSLEALNRAPWWRTRSPRGEDGFNRPVPIGSPTSGYTSSGSWARTGPCSKRMCSPAWWSPTSAPTSACTPICSRDVSERAASSTRSNRTRLCSRRSRRTAGPTGVANVRLHNVALGAEDDTLTLTRARFNSGDSRLSRLEASPAGGGVSVPVRPLDALLEGRPLDFVKIDVQGWELEVFKGMRGQLAGSRPLRIYFEFWPAGLRPAGSDPAELLAFLRQHGFRLHRTENHTLTPLPDDDYLEDSLKGTKWINLMAVR